MHCKLLVFVVETTTIKSYFVGQSVCAGCVVQPLGPTGYCPTEARDLKLTQDFAQKTKSWLATVLFKLDLKEEEGTAVGCPGLGGGLVGKQSRTCDEVGSSDAADWHAAVHQSGPKFVEYLTTTSEDSGFLKPRPQPK